MIRTATTSDIAGLCALEIELFGSIAWSRTQVTDEVQRARVRLTEDDHGITGYVVTMLGGDVTDLLRIGVRPDHQRRRLAGILLTSAIESADGVRMMLEVSDSNVAALSLYRGHGFEVIDRRRGYYRDGADALVMSRPLAQRRLPPSDTMEECNP